MGVWLAIQQNTIEYCHNITQLPTFFQ